LDSLDFIMISNMKIVIIATTGIATTLLQGCGVGVRGGSSSSSTDISGDDSGSSGVVGGYDNDHKINCAPGGVHWKVDDLVKNCNAHGLYCNGSDTMACLSGDKYESQCRCFPANQPIVSYGLTFGNFMAAGSGSGSESGMDDSDDSGSGMDTAFPTAVNGVHVPTPKIPSMDSLSDNVPASMKDHGNKTDIFGNKEADGLGF
jgi:hypothetical protein